MKRDDPQYNSRCGNGWSGFTSKVALKFIWDQNDISWWLNGTSKIS